MATKIMPISDLRRQATGIIKSLREEGDVVYITQHGRPSAVLIDYEEYEALLAQLKDEVDSSRLATREDELPSAGDSFLTIAQSVDLDGPPDWSANLDDYLYGGKQLDGH